MVSLKSESVNYRYSIFMHLHNSNMHSYRLKYVVLGLLIYLQNAFCRTCGSDFEDIASKAVLASTVFEGTVVEKSLNISNSYLYNATFEVIKTFKGSLPKHRRKYLRVTVGEFGPEDRELCNTHVADGSHYIVFLNTSQIDASFFTISNFPEEATKATKRQLRKILCNSDDCGECLRIQYLQYYACTPLCIIEHSYLLVKFNHIITIMYLNVIDLQLKR